MNLQALRRRCEARLRHLHLPAPFDAHVFCREFGAQRGRPILLHPITDIDPFSGLWIAGAMADHVFYEEQTSPLHQEHIIVHEVSHLLCGHEPIPVTEGEWSQLLFLYLRRETTRRILRRAAYSSEEEREAELLASLILERTASALPRGTPPQDPAAAHLLRRLEVSLEGHGERER